MAEPLYSDFQTNSSNPYYIHPNENPALVLVTPLLDDKNYHSWSRSMILALISKNKEKFVDGSFPKPLITDPLFAAWTRCNTLVLSWIQRSVSESIVKSVLWIDTAAVWCDLRNRFSQGSETMTLIALSMSLLDTYDHLALVFSLLGISVSFLVYLVPLQTFIQIFKRKSTKGFQSLPYVVALFSYTLWLYYALMKNDPILFLINAFGRCIETMYIIMYIIYVSRDARKSTIKLFLRLNAACFSVILLITHFALRDGDLHLQVLGWICVLFSVSVFAAPPNIVRRIMPTKSVRYMPFYLSLFLTLSVIMWFFYGLFNKDIRIPNIFGLILGLLRMALYGVYRRNGDGDVEMQAVAVQTQ